LLNEHKIQAVLLVAIPYLNFDDQRIQQIILEIGSITKVSQVDSFNELISEDKNLQHALYRQP
jgi:hypothetical protein